MWTLVGEKTVLLHPSASVQPEIGLHGLELAPERTLEAEQSTLPVPVLLPLRVAFEFVAVRYSASSMLVVVVAAGDISALADWRPLGKAGHVIERDLGAVVAAVVAEAVVVVSVEVICAVRDTVKLLVDLVQRSYYYYYHYRFHHLTYQQQYLALHYSLAYQSPFLLFYRLS